MFSIRVNACESFFSECLVARIIGDRNRAGVIFNKVAIKFIYGELSSVLAKSIKVSEFNKIRVFYTKLLFIFGSNKFQITILEL